MPYYARTDPDPKHDLEKRSQEYERKIEHIAGKLAESERRFGKGLKALREAHAFLSAINRDQTKDTQEWMSETLKKARPVLSILDAVIQEMERQQ